MSRRKLVLLLGVVGVTCASAALFIPGISPYARYPIYYVRCGDPPIIASDFAASYVYLTPGSEGYEVHPFVTRYFCTEKEAQAAGYRPPA